jgi:hypothetical protein
MINKRTRSSLGMAHHVKTSSYGSGGMVTAGMVIRGMVIAGTFTGGMVMGGMVVDGVDGDEDEVDRVEFPGVVGTVTGGGVAAGAGGGGGVTVAVVAGGILAGGAVVGDAAIEDGVVTPRATGEAGELAGPDGVAEEDAPADEVKEDADDVEDGEGAGVVLGDRTAAPSGWVA